MNKVSSLSCFSPLFLLCLISLLGCHPNSHIIEPSVFYIPQQRFVENLSPAFPPLSLEELEEDWGKELYLGIAFAREMDLYRALTCFKRSLILLLNNNIQRRQQIEYNMVFCYYLGNKYQEAIETFESSSLIDVPAEFPAFEDLLIILYDSYMQIDRSEKAYGILNLLASIDTQAATHLSTEAAVLEGNMESLQLISEMDPTSETIPLFLDEYFTHAKSVSKAQLLNAVLPGAGFYYVGQKKSALTSFLINALFITAAYQFFDRGYIAAGLITTSFEMGWYFGGINGAGLAAKEYNEQLYSALGKEMMLQNRLFPVLMLQKGF